MEKMQNEENDKLKSIKKKFTMDLVVAAIATIGLVVCAFFWKCKFDLPATILCGVVIVAGVALLMRQNKLLKEKYGEEEEIPSEQ